MRCESHLADTSFFVQKTGEYGMNFQEFEDKVKERIQEYLQKAGIENGSRITKTVDTDQNINVFHVKVPERDSEFDVNLDRLYQSFEGSQNLEKTLLQVNTIIGMVSAKWNPEDARDYEKVKGKLFTKIWNAEKNADYLARCVHTKVADLALTYHALINKDDYGLVSFVIKEQALELYHITKEQLHEDTLQNAAKLFPCRVTDMEDYIDVFVGEKELGHTLDQNPESVQIKPGSLYIVSNGSECGGASAIFYPGVLDLLAHSANGNFFILPSSTDEMLVASDDGTMIVEELNAIVQSVNRQKVPKEMWLGDEAYYYDATSQIFDKAANFTHLQSQNETVQLTGQSM